MSPPTIRWAGIRPQDRPPDAGEVLRQQRFLDALGGLEFLIDIGERLFELLGRDVQRVA